MFKIKGIKRYQNATKYKSYHYNLKYVKAKMEKYKLVRILLICRISITKKTVLISMILFINPIKERIKKKTSIAVKIVRRKL